MFYKNDESIIDVSSSDDNSEDMIHSKAIKAYTEIKNYKEKKN